MKEERGTNKELTLVSRSFFWRERERWRETGEARGVMGSSCVVLDDKQALYCGNHQQRKIIKKAQWSRREQRGGSSPVIG